MRVLLISEKAHDYSLIKGLLNQLRGDAHELSWCRADPATFADSSVRDCDVILWGAVSCASVTQELINELARQPGVPPILLITDEPPEPGASERPHRDILPRTGLTASRLGRAMQALQSEGAPPSQPESMSSDPLTGLNNRHAFRDQLANVLEHSGRPGSVGLLLIDIDQFKKVNASYGQGAGDALIQLIAERIHSCLSPNQRLARLGGNEFAVVFQNHVKSVETGARLRVDKIIECMRRPFPVAQHAVRMHASMGLVINSEPGITVDTMFARADMAMRIAKQEKGSNCQLYTRDMSDAAQQALKLEGDIRRGLQKEEFELHFQPRVDLAQQRIVGAEALIRWNHPVHGLLTPGEFIAVAEDSGLIVPMGYWVIRAACRHLRRLSACGITDMQIAVNVAFKQFQDRNFVSTVDGILRQYDIGPGQLEFELTETTMMVEGQSVDESLRKLHNLGIAISLDDFGTGYSSFAHIQRLPISRLKIDRSFVGSVSDNEDNATIVKAIISLAHSLNMQVIAEGAETSEQSAFLSRNRCDQAQGYYFSRPVPFSRFRRLLLCNNFTERHSRSAAGA